MLDVSDCEMNSDKQMVYKMVRIVDKATSVTALSSLIGIIFYHIFLPVSKILMQPELKLPATAIISA